MYKLCWFFVIAVMYVGGAYADVYSALQYVYDNNPVIKQGRAEVDAAQANLSLAKTDLQPYLGISGNVGVAHTQIDEYQFDYSSRQYGIEMQQNLFQGGTMFAKIKGADASLDAAVANQKATEQEVLLDAINAYIEVLNAKEVLKLNQNNERVLVQYYQFVKDGYDLGRMTNTDVSQAAARLEMAKYQVSDANAGYQNAIETVRRIFGDLDCKYHEIDTDKLMDLFPDSVQNATETALRQHPVLIALNAREIAAKQNIHVAYKSMLPQIDIRGTIQRMDNVPLLDDIQDSRVGVYLRMPLYDKGNAMANADRVRANVAAIHEQIINARRIVVENLTSAWNIFHAQRAALTAADAGVHANTVALAGIRDEQLHGRRTVLDVLNAEQELLNSRVAYMRANHAKVSAFFAVLAAMGKLTPENLGLMTE